MATPSHQTVRLSAGRHQRPEDGMCVMELASVLAGEPFSDAPRSVSPILAAVLRGYNDGLDDARRQSLKPLAAACVGTAAGHEAEDRRFRLVSSAMPEAQRSRGFLAGLLPSLMRVDPYEKARQLGRRVTAGDAELHARVLAFVDRLIAESGSPAADIEREATRALDAAPASP